MIKADIYYKENLLKIIELLAIYILNIQKNFDNKRFPTLLNPM
jgi:hypothetical protein